MRGSKILCLGAALVLLVGTSAQARVSHGYSEVFALDTVTTVNDQHDPPPANAIAAIYPNPFNPRTTIAFELADPGQIALAIVDLRGRLVRVLESGPRPTGRHQATWDGLDREGRAVPAGTYFCRLTTPQGPQTRKLTLAR
jgi:hypothetical protein